MTDRQADARVLVVDDEPYIADLLATGLRFVGFDVRTAGSGLEALTCVREWKPDLLVLDVMMPDVDGFEVTRRLRADGRETPVLFLTARDSVEDKVAGLTIGGDDYVTKPFSLEEIVARVRTLLRRRASSAPVEDHLLRCADVVLDEDAHEVSRAGVAVDLTPTEFSLLRYLMLNAGRVVSKAQILDHVWHYDFGGDGAVVESYISYLRRKIDAPFEVPLIRTVRGVGYTLREPRDGVG
ncbi:MAG: response regulator transcription factor [Actinomycetales bacterium]|nr:response regulator transcription factor [Actinomycetales bacterium]